MKYQKPQLKAHGSVASLTLGQNASDVGNMMNMMNMMNMPGMMRRR
ncbi:MAG: lasso RiPP family leader peptide-containing protein [Acidimicrobiales bacterium]